MKEGKSLGQEYSSALKDLVSAGDIKGLLQNINADGRGVKVALIDTGVNFPKLQKKYEEVGHSLNNITHALFKPEGQVDYSANKIPFISHGTVVADIILSHAPGAQIFSADVFGPRSFTELDMMLHAMRVAIHEWKCKIINLSLGLPEERIQQPWRRLQLLNALEDAYRNDVMVFAAGHNDHPLSRSFPAVFESSLFSVNKKQLEGMLKFKYFPELGLEFLGHGYGDLAPTGSDAATSWATAHLTGTALKIASLYPKIKPFEMKTILYWISQEWIKESSCNP